MNHEQRITDHESAAECLTEPGRVTRPDVFQLLAREDSDDTSAINVCESSLTGIELTIKRLVDIGGALFGLVLFSPVMLLISILIPLTSRGPVFYRQKRVGLNGQIFEILKFRSMPPDAESSVGAVWATVADERPTPLGKFIRRTSLDELPQLFNVLQGDMSLVGPRPERPVFVDGFSKTMPYYDLRHKVKPGITGWAQVNGWRGNTSIEKRVECDLYYIQNWSLWFDLWIILLTIVKGFINKNAY